MHHGRVFRIAQNLQRNQHQRRVPGRTASPVKAPAAGGDDSRKRSVCPLRVQNILYPLAVSRYRVIIREHLLGGQLRVARPAVLLPMRTVRRNVHIIGQSRPDTRLVDPVQHLIAAGKSSDLFQVGMDKTGFDFKGFRCLIPCCLHFHIAESVIGEARLKLFKAVFPHGFPAADIFIRMPKFIPRVERIDIALIHMLSVFGKPLCIQKFYNCPLCGPDADSGPAGQIDPAIIQLRSDLLHRVHRCHPDRRLCRFFQNSAGRTADNSLFPLTVIIAGQIKTALFQSCVVTFSAPHMVESDRSFVSGPVLVRNDGHSSPVRKFSP